MSDTIVVGLLSSIPSLLLALATLIITHSRDRENTKIQVITNRRIEWSEILRKEIGEYIIGAQKFFYCGILQSKMADIESGKRFFDESSETVALGYKIILRLNPKDDIEIIDLINKINIYISGNESEIPAKEFADSLKRLVELAHEMLKKEWEKVKSEAGYKRINRSLK